MRFIKMFGDKKQEIKTGLALGSGGTKGLAHIGALSAFAEEGIEFDIVAGTSIGSIIGGMYAKRYSPDDMISLINELNLTSYSTIIKLGLSGITVTGLLKKVLGDITFDELKKPFRAVAADLYSGEEKVMGSGDLCSAMAASSAMPPVFRPVLRDGRYLVDGAFLNYVPADVCKILGADVVVGINLGKEHRTNERSKKMLDELYPDNKIPLTDRSKKGYECSDIMVEPDLSAYRAALTKGADEMFYAGYYSVKAKTEEIKKLLRMQ